MTEIELDHRYLETHSWDATVRFWNDLGARLVEERGSDGHCAGRFELGDASVVVAEEETGPAAANAVFRTDALVDPGGDIEVVTPPEPTHWGTRWMRARDPDGHIHVFETKEQQ